jgi:hypothetical protein
MTTLSMNMASATTNTIGNTTTYAYTTPDGKITISESLTISGSVMTNMHIVVTLNGLQDTTSGYTISGTLTIDENLTYSGSTLTGMSGTYVADLNYSGTGPLQKLTINLSMTATSGSVSTPTYSGNVTCNGQPFSPSDLGTGF